MIKIIVNVLDDEQWILDEIKNMFDSNIFTINTYTQAKNFTQAFNDDVYLVITDVRVNGYDVVESLQSFRKNNSGVWLIVMSAYLDNIWIELVNKCHIDYAVQKNSTNWLQVLESYISELIPKIKHKAKVYHDS